MQNLTAYVLALLGLLSLPGPTNALLAASGATVGLGRSLPLLLWELLAYVSAIAVERAVLLPAIERLPAATRLLDAVAALYLIGLALVLWRSRLGVGAQSVRAHQMILTTVLNPKGLIIAVLIMPLHPSAFHPAAFHPAALHPAALLPAALHALAGTLRDWGVLLAAIPVSGIIWLCAGRYVQSLAAPRLALLVPRTASLALGLFAVLLIVRLLR
jgi:threonine/homoserine/homoserine lactone efflux protein